MATSDNETTKNTMIQDPKLYTYENDYREQHAKHIQRPAVVAIKKPFFTADEMEETLTRLLVKYFPPTTENKTYKTSAGYVNGFGVKAYLIDHSVISTVNDQIYTPDSSIKNIFAVGRKENIYLSSSVLADFGQTKDPINANRIINTDALSNYINSNIPGACQDAEYKYFSDSSDILDGFIEKAKEQSTNEAQSDINAAALNVTPDKLRRYDVLVLGEGYQNYLAPEKKAKTATASILVKNSMLFGNDHNFPTYLGMKVLFDPAKPKGTHNTLSAEEIEKDLGYVPEQVVKAHWWTFVVPPSTKVNILSDSALADYQKDPVNESKKDIYLQQWLSCLVSLLRSYYSELTPGDRIGYVSGHISYKSAYDALGQLLNTKTDYTKYSKDENNPVTRRVSLLYGNQLCTFIKENAETLRTFNNLDDQKTNAKLVAGLIQANSVAGAIVTGGVSRLIKMFGGIEDAVLEKTTTILKKKTIVDLMIEACDTYNTQVEGAFNYTEAAVPFLGLDKETKHLMESEQKKARSNAITRQFTTLKDDSHLSMKDVTFKAKYYSVLLTKLKKKYDRLKPFIDSGIVTFKLQSEFDVLMAVITKYPYIIDEIDKYSPDKAIITNNDITPANYESAKAVGNITPLKFMETAESLLFGPLSGFFITSYDPGLNETKAPIWNALATKSEFKAKIGGADLGDDAAYILLDNQNKDISGIEISRVILGRSTANIQLKNNKQKYNYPRNYAGDRSAFIIEPLDEVVVFLPTIEYNTSGGIPQYSGRLEPVFSGVVSVVTELNDAGYHAINIEADCCKKWLEISRTNVKPSATAEENGNNPITAFIVPNAFYKSIEKWMPFMFAQSLTYMRCMPSKTTRAQFTASKAMSSKKNPVVIRDTQIYYVNKAIESTREIRKEVEVPVSYTMEYKYKYKPDLLTQGSVYVPSADWVETGSAEIPWDEYRLIQRERTDGKDVKPKIGDTKEEFRYETREKVVGVEKYVSGFTTTAEARQNQAIGTYNQFKFTDPLYNYLWYKRCSKHMPKEELALIEKSLEELLNFYVSTDIIYSNGRRTTKDGVTSYEDVLKSSGRAAYIIYKQRYGGTLTEKNNVSAKEKKESTEDSTSTKNSTTTQTQEVKDRIIVAKLMGTSQPTYLLQGQGLNIQFSNWKTNNEIITDTANRFNFIYYTDANGIVNFTPYNLDLTTLNTYNHTKDIDTDKMLITRSSRDLEYEVDNVQILKQQYMYTYRKSIDDSRIVNWVRISGEWQVDTTANTLTQALVIDPVLMRKFGYRPAKNVNILGVQNSDSLRLYGLAWMDRNNKRYIAADASCLFDARMDINLPYYVPNDEVIYYCDGMRISYRPGVTCTCDMSLTFGKKPIMSVEPFALGSTLLNEDGVSGSKNLCSNLPATYDGENLTLIQNLDKIFKTKNEIKPSTYAQYKKLLTGVSETKSVLDTPSVNLNSVLDLKLNTGFLSVPARNASICCYNGYLWDNVAGISFEELVYTYGWLYNGKNVTGFTMALSKDDLFMESLISKLTKTGGDMNITAQAQNVINSYFIDIPSIQDKNKLPAELAKWEVNYEDLLVPGIVE